MSNLNQSQTKLTLLLACIAIINGLTLCLAFPPYNLTYWIFPCFIIFILGLNYTKAFFSYGFYFYFGAVNAFIGYWFSYYFATQLNTNYIVAYLFTLIICVYTSLYIGLLCSIYNKIKTPSQLFNLCCLLPALWTIIELIRGLFFPRSWYVLGNTQVNVFLFKGYFSVFGVYFVSFLIICIVGWLCYLILNYKNFQFKLTLLYLISSCILFTGISVFLAKVQYTQVTGAPIAVTLVQPNIASNKNFTQDKLKAIESTVYALTKTSQGKLIILPETIFDTNYLNLTPGYFPKLQSLVKHKNAQLIFGSPFSSNDNKHQTGTLNISYPQQPIYIKHNLVPFGEYNPWNTAFINSIINTFNFQLPNFIPGNNIQEPFTFNTQKLSFNICYENVINDYVALNARDASILVNQSDLSWYGKTYMKDLSTQFSQVRALENQRYFIQDGNSGDTLIINQNGTIVKSIPAFTKANLEFKVPGYTGTTPFQKGLNYPIWLLCLVIIIFSLGLKLTYKK
jgi:apolipoprotein N-acyltransferase